MAVSLFLLSRRLTGAFDFPLPGVGLFLCAVGLIALTSVVRTLLVQIAWSPSVWMLGIVWLVPTAAMLMTAIAVSLPQTPFWTLFLFWGLLVCAELAWTTPNTQLGDWTTDWFRRFSETSGPRTNHLEKAGDPDRDTRSQPILAEPVPTDSLTSDSLTSDSEMADSEMADSEMSEPVQPMADDVIQQLVRTRDSRAEESLAGCVRVDVAAGQSTARSHIGFSPIFPGEPRVYVEPREQDNLSVTAMVAHVSTLGVRIDVRISPAADVDRIVWLDVFATWTPPDDQSKGAGDQGPAR